MTKHTSAIPMPKRSEYQADWTYADALEDYAVSLKHALEAIVEAGRMSDQSRAKYCAEIAHNALNGFIAGEVGTIQNTANAVNIYRQLLEVIDRLAAALRANGAPNCEAMKERAALLRELGEPV